MSSKFYFLFLAKLCILTACSSQANVDLALGQWEGVIPRPDAFSFEISLEFTSSSQAVLAIKNGELDLAYPIKVTDQVPTTVTLDEGIELDLYYAANQPGAISAFLRSGIFMYHLDFEPLNAKYQAQWRPFMVDALADQSVYLSFERDNDQTVAYPFFGDQRFTGTWAGNFQWTKEGVHFRDYKTGIQFQAIIHEDKVALSALLAKKTVWTADLTKSTEDWNIGALPTNGLSLATPPNLEDGWKVANATTHQLKLKPLAQLLDSLQANRLPNVQSVLIAQQGHLLMEAYPQGFNAFVPHDQRSASKSIASAILGPALRDQIIQGTDQPVFDLLPAKYQDYRDSDKANIRIQDLLTMSGGLDISRNSSAAESNYQNTDEWVEAVLQAAMANVPGQIARYGSAYPFLVGICLEEQLQIPLEHYLHQQLFAPLGISNYILQTDNTQQTPYFGGGTYLTPRDMLKLGQLYLNQGKWNGQQVLSSEWVERSFQEYFKLEGTRDNNGYGYFWWHHDYDYAGKKIHSLEARGNGGQYIFVLPELASVVVITSGNYRNRSLLQQPEDIMTNYILPAIGHLRK